MPLMACTIHLLKGDTYSPIHCPINSEIASVNSLIILLELTGKNRNPKH